MEEEERELNQIINNNIINRLIDMIYSPSSLTNISYSYNDDYYIDDDTYYRREEDADILNTSFLNDKKKYKIVLADEEEDEGEQFKIIKYIKGGDDNDKCPIMSTLFEDGQDIIQLPCKHSFEPEAIKKWLKEEKAECPVCRYNQFKTKEIKIEEEEGEENLINRERLDIYTELIINSEEEYDNEYDNEYGYEYGDDDINYSIGW